MAGGEAGYSCVHSCDDRGDGLAGPLASQPDPMHVYICVPKGRTTLSVASMCALASISSFATPSALFSAENISAVNPTYACHDGRSRDDEGGSGEQAQRPDAAGCMHAMIGETAWPARESAKPHAYTCLRSQARDAPYLSHPGLPWRRQAAAPRHRLCFVRQTSAPSIHPAHAITAAVAVVVKVSHISAPRE